MIDKPHIDKSISIALRGESGIDPEILKVRGFSTPTIRHLFHALCNTEEPINYLEIGLFCGASFCASFNKNCVSFGIEDHSQDFSVGFDKVKEELKENVDKFCDKGKLVDVHYADCFNMDLGHLLPIDIYFFDGWHSEETQTKALPYFIDKMNDTFAWVVDDINWSYVASGTQKGLESLKDRIEVMGRWPLRGKLSQEDKIWHNGVDIYLINKK